jgi:hypothetical protein
MLFQPKLSSFPNHVRGQPIESIAQNDLSAVQHRAASYADLISTTLADFLLGGRRFRIPKSAFQ